MNWLPLLHRSNNVKFIIFGGGRVAQRKVQTLVKFTQVITIISPVFDDRLLELIEKHQLNKITSIALAEHISEHPKHLPKENMGKTTYIVAATDDTLVNQQIAGWARDAACPVSIADDPKNSDFIFPAIIDRNPVMIAVSSSSESPALTRYLRNQLDSLLPARLPQLAKFVSSLRTSVRATVSDTLTRQRIWRSLMSSPMPNLVLAGKDKQAENIAKQVIATSQNSRQKDGSQKDSQGDNKAPCIGEVFLVGAGPGDPELLTLKAVRLIQQADVVFYDRLVSPAILEYCNAKAEMHYVGKAMSNHAVPQEGINQLLVDHAKLGKTVLRLKGGDPFIFGRGGEEIEQLAQESVPFQVVPGITAASGCSSYSGIPLTHRDYAQSVRFVTGHLKDGTANLPWHELVYPNQTLVVYMGLSGIVHISQELIRHGMSEDTGIALIEKGTLPEQKVYASTLKDIASVIANNHISAPTLTIVGDVVKLHEKLNWR
jgi:uroporphyrin-III C-methyltransferase/precorrin-2 dehydrogenase/sirohydrochlorin ferrochelatase